MRPGAPPRLPHRSPARHAHARCGNGTPGGSASPDHEARRGGPMSTPIDAPFPPPGTTGTTGMTPPPTTGTPPRTTTATMTVETTTAVPPTAVPPTTVPSTTDVAKDEATNVAQT